MQKALVKMPYRSLLHVSTHLELQLQWIEKLPGLIGQSKHMMI